jgi:hypothetical protein
MTECCLERLSNAVNGAHQIQVELILHEIHVVRGETRDFGTLLKTRVMLPYKQTHLVSILTSLYRSYPK